MNNCVITDTFATSSTTMPYINKISFAGVTNEIRDTSAHNEIEELKEKINKLTAKPYFMKIQCHNCGASLTINSENHLVKCKYCHTAYFSGTQLVNAV